MSEASPVTGALVAVSAAAALAVGSAASASASRGADPDRDLRGQDRGPGAVRLQPGSLPAADRADQQGGRRPTAASSRASGSTRSPTRRSRRTNAEELIGKGAVAIVATCDFDFSFPRDPGGRRPRTCRASRCARRRRRSRRRRSSASTAARWASARTPRASTAAEWMRTRTSPSGGARTSSRTPRSSTRRRRPTTSRLAGRSSAARSAARTPSSAARTSTSRRRSRALRGKVAGCDVIYNGSWQPCGSQLMRASPRRGHRPADHRRTPRSTARSSTEVAGQVSDFYALGLRVPARRTAEGTQTPAGAADRRRVQGQVRRAAREPLRAAGLRARRRASQRRSRRPARPTARRSPRR